MLHLKAKKGTWRQGNVSNNAGQWILQVDQQKMKGREQLWDLIKACHNSLKKSYYFFGGVVDVIFS